MGLPDPPIQLVSQIEPAIQPLESARQPLDYEPRLADEGAAEYVARGSTLSSASLRELRRSSPTSDVVGRGQVATTAPTDLGSLLQESDDVQTVNSQRRSHVAFDPHVRGYNFGQIYTQAAGEYFLPVRHDLDSMLSKIDPSLIQTVTVIPGPYGLRYGPGFSFIDVVTIDTPRSCCGIRYGTIASAFSARGNGGQIYRPRYGHGRRRRTTGSSPTSASSRAPITRPATASEFLRAITTRTCCCSSASTCRTAADRGLATTGSTLRDTEYALQFFDVNSLQTDSFNLRYVEHRSVPPAPMTIGPGLVQPDELRRQQPPRQQDAKFATRVANGLNDDFRRDGCFNANCSAASSTATWSRLGARAVRTYGEETGEYAAAGRRLPLCHAEHVRAVSIPIHRPRHQFRAARLKRTFSRISRTRC